MCSLNQYIGLFSRDTPKFDPYSLMSGDQSHFIHSQHASGINLWNKTVPHVYVIAKTTPSLEVHPKSWHPFPHKSQVFQVYKALNGDQLCRTSQHMKRYLQKLWNAITALWWDDSLYDGTLLLYDGTLSLYDGTLSLYDDTLSLYDGTSFKHVLKNSLYFLVYMYKVYSWCPTYGSHLTILLIFLLFVWIKYLTFYISKVLFLRRYLKVLFFYKFDFPEQYLREGFNTTLGFHFETKSSTSGSHAFNCLHYWMEISRLFLYHLKTSIK